MHETFEFAAVGLAHVGKDGSWLRVNKRLCEITGYTAAELLRKRFQDITHLDDLKADLNFVELALAGEINNRWTDKRYLRKDGSTVWVRLSVAAMRKKSGALDYFNVVVEDIEEQKQAESALRESEQRLRLANEAAGIGTFTIDLDTGYASYSPELSKMLGFPGVPGASVEAALARVHRDDVPRVRGLYETVFANADTGQVKMDFRFVRPGGEVRWMTWIGRVNYQRGKPLRVVGACLDITDRKRQEEHLGLLLREVDHRSQNILSVVQSIARQTLTAKSEDFLSSFEERIRALAASHQLLVRNEWKGADLEELIRAQLRHFKGLIGSRIKIGGRALKIEPGAAQALGMAIHELSTNAGKYGALSSARGEVRIAWDLDRTGSGETFVISWRESAGPPVSPPTRRGFGYTVVSTVLERDLNAQVELDYRLSGFSWRLVCPVDRLLNRTTL